MLKPAGWWETSMNFLASCYSKVVQHTISKYNGWEGLSSAMQIKIPTVEWLILQFFLYSQCRHLDMTILVPRKSSYWIFSERERILCCRPNLHLIFRLKILIQVLCWGSCRSDKYRWSQSVSHQAKFHHCKIDRTWLTWVRRLKSSIRGLYWWTSAWKD